MTGADGQLARRGDKPRVLIAGGGVAALETVLALRESVGEEAEIVVVAPQEALVYAPMAVAEPFGAGEVRTFDLAEVAADVGFRLVFDSVDSVDAVAAEVRTTAGARIAYDRLVLAVGARRRPWLDGALHFGGRSDVAPLRALLDEVERGDATRVAFVMPPGESWSLPLYELALLTTAYGAGSDVEPPRVMMVTPEDAPLAIFGSEAGAAVAALLDQRGIEVWTESYAAFFRRPRLQVIPDGTLFVDAVVALCTLRGPALPGLPCDRHGFIRVDERGAVPGVSSVWAAGDGTTHPVKQGGAAAQQADVAAADVAASIGAAIAAVPPPAALHGLLLTGGDPLYLSSNGGSVASPDPLWWPPAKIAARHLAPYLARHAAA